MRMCLCVRARVRERGEREREREREREKHIQNISLIMHNGEGAPPRGVPVSPQEAAFASCRPPPLSEARQLVHLLRRRDLAAARAEQRRGGVGARRRQRAGERRAGAREGAGGPDHLVRAQPPFAPASNARLQSQGRAGWELRVGGGEDVGRERRRIVVAPGAAVAGAIIASVEKVFRALLKVWQGLLPIAGSERVGQEWILLRTPPGNLSLSCVCDLARFHDVTDLTLQIEIN